jgi:polyisoprenoid-binding protein YceI
MNTLSLLGIVAVAALATNPAPNTAQIRFAGQSTLHDFHGSVTSDPIQFHAHDGKWSAATTIKVAAMNTANNKRDAEMRRMFDEPAFPVIRGVVTDAPVPTTATTNIVMDLTIRDVTKPVTVTITDWQAQARGYRFHGAVKVSLKEFGLKAPAVLGLIRVADTVTFDADVTIGEVK